MTPQIPQSRPAPQIEIGKTPEQFLNAAQLYWLPSNTPFGNLQRIPISLISRLDCVNLKIREIYDLHERLLSSTILLQLPKYEMLLSELVFWLANTVDDLIMVISLLEAKVKHDSYPNKIEICDMGALLNRSETSEELRPLLDQHRSFFSDLNNAYNSLKHHLVRFDSNLLAVDQPRFICLYNLHNNTEKGVKQIELNINELVSNFSTFYKQATDTVRSLGLEIQKKIDKQ